MRRREFITLLSGAAAWPLAARAQQRIPRVGFLFAGTPSVWSKEVAAFAQRLGELGWIEGRTVAIEYRWVESRTERLAAAAAEFVELKVDVIVTPGTAVPAVKQVTSVIPIVFPLGSDPVASGFVASLARPGGNVTGFTLIDFPIMGKWLELLKEIAPGIRRMTFMFSPPTAPWVPLFLRELGAAPASLAVELSETPVHDEAEIKAAITAFAREPGGGLIISPDPFMNTHRGLVMALAKRYRLPAIHGFRQHVTDGALMSYGPDTADIVRRSASYVDRILKGEKPAELPVQAPIKLVINLKTAKALGLEVPLQLQQLADEVIE